jgi:hypothetical protein
MGARSTLDAGRPPAGTRVAMRDPLMRARASRKATLEVAIVSNNPETLDGLQSYLSAAGVMARCTRDLLDCVRFAPASTLAFVLFPDDFRWETVIATIAELTESRPKALPVLVTSQPQRFESLTAPDSVLIVPRPAWGWTILDAIRAHLDGDGSKDTEGSFER